MKSTLALVVLACFVLSCYCACGTTTGYVSLNPDSNSFVKWNTPYPTGTGTTNFTVEAWINTRATDLGMIYRWRWNGAVLLMAANGFPSFGYCNISGCLYITSDTAYNDGAWHHLAGMLSGPAQHMLTLTIATHTHELAVLYVDGQAVVSSIGNGAIYFGMQGASSIGKDGDADDGFFNGSIAEFRIWNTALDIHQIQANLQSSIREPTANLVMSLPLDTLNSAGHFEDFSGGNSFAIPVNASVGTGGVERRTVCGSGSLLVPFYLLLGIIILVQTL